MSTIIVANVSHIFAADQLQGTGEYQAILVAIATTSSSTGNNDVNFILAIQPFYSELQVMLF
jgi:hypothetical protein